MLNGSETKYTNRKFMVSSQDHSRAINSVYSFFY